MAKEGQPKTDYGEKGETGEKEPAGAKSSDSGGERKRGIVNGVAMGMEDKTGRKNGGKDMGEYNEGRQSDGSVCYQPER